MSKKSQKPNRPNCFHCAHFYITHEVSFPYGCTIMGFKSERLPSVVTLESSGMDCQSFAAKTGRSSHKNIK